MRAALVNSPPLSGPVLPPGARGTVGSIAKPIVTFRHRFHSVVMTPADAEPDTTAAAPKRRPDLAAGIAAVRDSARTLPGSPGVYRMIDDRGTVLYVGKARNLKRRVSQYANPSRMPTRIVRMIAETSTIEIVITHTEVEALLLESNLIKRLKPRYNILLRDDKSFPYILITTDHEAPRLLKHRGAQSRKGYYFGPFATVGAVNRTLSAMQRAFLLRNCSDSVYRNRSRPCLQYQIKRCAAPCVNYIDPEGYAALVKEARAFLSGRSRQIREEMAARMHEASDRLDFETAAAYRDRIRALAAVQAHQDINVDGLGDADVFAVHAEGPASCIQVFFFRGGGNYGNRAYFPGHDASWAPEEILSAFIAQFYDNRRPPRQVLVSHPLPEQQLLAEALSVRAAARVTVTAPVRGRKRNLVTQAAVNARDALARRQAQGASHRRLLGDVSETFGLDEPPGRIEVYDNSHLQGADAVGAMIVFGSDGFEKAAYRRFTIRDAAAGSEKMSRGDDYAMMRQVLRRRFARALKEDAGLPDLVLIDGGPGQLGAAWEVLDELGIADLAVVAISKGPDRNAGRERFHQRGRPSFLLPERTPVLYFLQRLRDEAHRFAIETHRARRHKASRRSALDEVPGIGAKRKRALLNHFGSAREVARAGLADLETVQGISSASARRIYEHFH